MRRELMQAGRDPGDHLTIIETSEMRLMLKVNSWGEEASIVLSDDEEELLATVLRVRAAHREKKGGGLLSGASAKQQADG